MDAERKEAEVLRLAAASINSAGTSTAKAGGDILGFTDALKAALKSGRSADIFPARYHRKRRIRKKWAKRYGWAVRAR